MFKLNPFALPDAEVIRRRQLSEAQRELLAHEAALENHAASVAMYRQRIARLSNVVGPAPLMVGKSEVQP